MLHSEYITALIAAESAMAASRVDWAVAPGVRLDHMIATAHASPGAGRWITALPFPHRRHPVQSTHNPQSPAIQHMTMDHDGDQIAVTGQLLYGAALRGSIRCGTWYGGSE